MGPACEFKTSAPSPLDSLVRLWALRLVAHLPRQIRPGSESSAAEGSGWYEVSARMCQAWKAEDPGGLLWLPSTPQLDVLRRLAKAIDLSPLEHQLLVWVYLVRVEPLLLAPSSGMGSGWRRLELVSLLEQVLGAESGALHPLLQPDSKLVRSGLLVCKPSGDWRDWLGLPDFLVKGLHVPPVDPVQLLQGHMDRAQRPALRTQDFTHLGAELDALEVYLDECLKHRRSGVNVLIYGPSGAYKAELARLLAQNLQATLFEVPLSDVHGKPREALSRMNGYAIGQMALGDLDRPILLFDELESSFVSGGEDRGEALRGFNAWIDRSMESNPVVTIWVTHDPSALDPDFLRRFDVALEVGTLPRGLRRRILASLTETLIMDDKILDQLDARPNVPFGLLAKAVEATRVICKRRWRLEPGQVLLRLLDGRLPPAPSVWGWTASDACWAKPRVLWVG